MDALHVRAMLLLRFELLMSITLRANEKLALLRILVDVRDELGFPEATALEQQDLFLCHGV